MELGTPKTEACLRIVAIFLLVLTACLAGLDVQKKNMVYLEKKVTYKDLKALIVLVYVDSVAAAYNLLQLSRSSFLHCYKKGNFKGSYRSVAWCCYLLDQIAVYITFAASTAALEHSVLVVTGAEVFQWLKCCNRFSRFCFQIGGSILCSYTACVIMAFISFISAFNLFRLYSPTHFLLLKGT